MTKAKSPPEPWLPVYFTARDAYAIQALARGEADADQQQRAFAWIANKASAVDDLSFRPGPSGDRETAFAEGRRFVGLQIYKLKGLKSEVLEKLDVPN